MAKTYVPDNPYAGHRAVQLNICHDSDPDNPHPLKAGDGSYCERMVDVNGSSAYAASICKACYIKHQEGSNELQQPLPRPRRKRGA